MALTKQLTSPWWSRIPTLSFILRNDTSCIRSETLTLFSPGSEKINYIKILNTNIGDHAYGHSKLD